MWRCKKSVVCVAPCVAGVVKCRVCVCVCQYNLCGLSVCLSVEFYRRYITVHGSRCYIYRCWVQFVDGSWFHPVGGPTATEQRVYHHPNHLLFVCYFTTESFLLSVRRHKWVILTPLELLVKFAVVCLPVLVLNRLMCWDSHLHGQGSILGLGECFSVGWVFGHGQGSILGLGECFSVGWV